MLLSAESTQVVVRWYFMQNGKIHLLLCTNLKVGVSSLLLKPDDSAQIPGRQVAQTADVGVSAHLSGTKWLNE